MKWRFHPEALREHLGHVAFYEARRKGLGAAYLVEFEAALGFIGEEPRRFGIASPPDSHRFHMSRFPITIFYRERLGELLVLAAGHKRRRPGYWERRA